MYKHPRLRRTPPCHQRECHELRGDLLKYQASICEGSDNVISISYHLSPAFFHYRVGHWVWRTVKMPGFWKTLHGVERSRHPRELHGGFLPWGSGERPLPAIRRRAWESERKHIKPSGAGFGSEGLGKRCQTAPGERERTQATREKGVKVRLTFFTARNMLYSWEKSLIFYRL